MATIANMTLEDLKKFVEKALDKRLTQLFGTFEIPAEPNEDDGRTWDEIRTLVAQHRWTPPQGAKSSLELLREDRER
jgi:hypothetical protein